MFIVLCYCCLCCVCYRYNEKPASQLVKHLLLLIWR